MAIAPAFGLLVGGGALWAAALLPAPVQEARGAALYAQQCASCHGAAMRGGDGGTSLLGASFVRKWRGRPVFALFEKIRVTMPQDDPGTLRPDQAMELTELILAANGIQPAGIPLPRDPAALQKLVIAQ